MGVFNFPDINLKYHTSVKSMSLKFLKFAGGNFLLLSEPTRKGVLLDLLFVNKDLW